MVSAALVAQTLVVVEEVAVVVVVAAVAMAAAVAAEEVGLVQAAEWRVQVTTLAVVTMW